MKNYVLLVALLASSVSFATEKKKEVATTPTPTATPSNEIAFPNFDKIQTPEKSHIPSERDAISGGKYKTVKQYQGDHPQGGHRPNGNMKLGE